MKESKITRRENDTDETNCGSQIWFTCCSLVEYKLSLVIIGDLKGNKRVSINVDIMFSMKNETLFLIVFLSVMTIQRRKKYKISILNCL